jgi:protein O-mannosyl-transferase
VALVMILLVIIAGAGTQLIMNNEQSASVNGKAAGRLISRPLIHYLLICITGLIIYSNTFSVPFQWDEAAFINDNIIVKNFDYFLNPSSAEGLQHYNSFNRRYVSFLAFALNYAIHGYEVTGYHIVNLLIHLISAILVYLLACLIFRTPFFENSGLRSESRLIALFAALLFVSHPLQTMAVTYIYQRITSLVALFYLLSLTAYIKSRLTQDNPRRYAFYLVSLVSAILAMKTKENAFTLPFVVLMVEFLFFTGPVKPRLLRMIPILLTLLIVPLSLDKLHGESIRVAGAMPSRSSYLFTQFSVLLTYIRLLFLPVNQTLLYDFPKSVSFFEPRVALSFLGLMGIFLSGVYFFIRSRTAAPEFRIFAFGIFWFFITHAVESSIIPLIVIQEYRMYLPSAGLFMAFSAAIFYFSKKINIKQKNAILACCVIILALSAVTYARNAVWGSRISLWEDVVKKSPGVAAGHFNLGYSYSQEKMFDNAIEQYRLTVKLIPDDYNAYAELGIAYAGKGLLDDAIEQYRIALSINPDYYYAHHNMGYALYRKGLFDKAIEEFQQAVRLNPGFAQSYVNMGIAYGDSGNLDKAIESFRTAIKLEDKLAEAHFNLGVAYQKTGAIPEAIGHLKTAAELKPDYADTYNRLTGALRGPDRGDLSAGQNQEDYMQTDAEKAEDHYLRGNALFKQGLADRAIEEYRSAIRLNPSFAGAHYNLGVALLQKNMKDEAIRELNIAVQLNPGFHEAHSNLGTAYANNGMIDMAVRHFEIAVKLKPDNPLYRNNLDKAYELIKSGNKAGGPGKKN